MESYRNFSQDSGVTAFEIGEDYIKVKFIDGGIYLYNYKSPGMRQVEDMKKLAVSGKGLSAYIATHIRKSYFAKLT
jgi:hypothetical protein